MGVQLSSKPVVTEPGDGHLLLVGTDGLKQIKPTDLGISGGGGGTGVHQFPPNWTGALASSGGLQALKGTVFKATGALSIKALWGMYNHGVASAAGITVELVLVTIVAGNFGAILARKTALAKSWANDYAAPTAVLDTPVTVPADTVFAVVMRDPAAATATTALKGVTGNPWNMGYPLPVELNFPTVALRLAALDVVVGGTPELPTGTQPTITGFLA